MALRLRNEGVLLGICSKNNAADVEEVLEKHPAMLIRNGHLAVKRVNWQDKAANLREISSELNISLDSLVFIDDSSFETELIKGQIPEISVYQVPEKLSEYPAMFRELSKLFYVHSRSEEDRVRSRLYAEEQKRKDAQPQFNSMDEYLESLRLKLRISVDRSDQIPRIAQLTQKTNQFNLTTKRYTDSEIGHFVSDPNFRVITFELQDRFGNYGLTGVAIIAIDPEVRSAEIDTLLMSCRVLGRGVEGAFLDFIVKNLRDSGVSRIRSSYIKTKKNDQVANFYSVSGFTKVDDGEGFRNYQADAATYPLKDGRPIEIIHEP